MSIKVMIVDEESLINVIKNIMSPDSLYERQSVWSACISSQCVL